MIRRLLILYVLCAVPLRVAIAVPQTARPAGPLLIADVRLEEDAESARVSIVVRGGRITQVLPAGTPAPAGLRLIEGDGALCLPAFIDAFTQAGCVTPEPQVDRDIAPDVQADVALGMREANRKGLQPAFRAVDVLKFDDAVLEGFRRHGFGVMHSAPDEELLAGQSALVTSGPSAVRDRVLQAVVGQSAGLRARGGGYPSTLMGSMAQLRQFFLDAGLHERRLAQPEVGRRVPYDADLDVGVQLLSGEQRVWARADERGDIERWLGLAEEFGLQLVIVGGRDAWMLAERLKAAEIAVVLTLEWGDEPKDPAADSKPDDKSASDAATAATVEQPQAKPDAQDEPEDEASDEPPDEGEPQDNDEPQTADDATQSKSKEESTDKDGESAKEWIYEEPLALRTERRRLWEQHRDGARRLAESGVAIAFGSLGEGAKDLHERIAALIKAGFDPTVATRALTIGAAELFGETARLGRVEPGFEAHLALWTAAPWSEGAKLSWMIVDGESFELAAADNADDAAEAEVEATGDWRLSFAENQRADAEMQLTMAEDGTVTGTAKYSAPNGDAFEVEMKGTVSGDRLRLTATTQVQGFPIEISVDARITGDEMNGKTTWKTAGGSESNEFHGERQPQGEGQ